jgi:hypothetical protein
MLEVNLKLPTPGTSVSNSVIQATCWVALGWILLHGVQKLTCRLPQILAGIANAVLTPLTTFQSADTCTLHILCGHIKCSTVRIFQMQHRAGTVPPASGGSVHAAAVVV